MNVELVSKTQGVGKFKDRSIDEMIVGMARVSTSKENNELFKNPAGLIRYCLQQGHWSVFESADLAFEIETSMSIGEQLLRHRSATFQKFSGRYSTLSKMEDVELRKQAETNRQSSSIVIDDDAGLKDLFNVTAELALHAYNVLIESGVARETARLILPAGIQTKLFMKTNIRSWITFLNVRLDNHAQKEIREIAKLIRDAFIAECPIISEALYNFEGAEDGYILDRLVVDKYNKQ